MNRLKLISNRLTVELFSCRALSVAAMARGHEWFYLCIWQWRACSLWCIMMRLWLHFLSDKDESPHVKEINNSRRDGQAGCPGCFLFHEPDSRFQRCGCSHNLKCDWWEWIRPWEKEVTTGILVLQDFCIFPDKMTSLVWIYRVLGKYMRKWTKLRLDMMQYNVINPLPGKYTHTRIHTFYTRWP